MKQLQEMLDFIFEVTSALRSQKEDDGEIDFGEALYTMVSNAPAGVRAMLGAGEIPGEIKGMSAQQKEDALIQATQAIKELIEVFWDKKK